LFRCELEGALALLFNNPAQADPFNPLMTELKQIMAKKKKTETDHLEIMRLQWRASWYYD
jgi:hypothetical protein